MSRVNQNGAQPAVAPAGDVETEVARIGAMNLTELRALWRDRRNFDPPPAFSKDLLARALAHDLQQQAHGGLKPQTARLLRALATKPGAEQPRQVKVGSIIVREHKGALHEVMVVPGGFCWRGATYDSLSTIAKKITGVNWNGPRFFGLRSKKETALGTDPAGKCDASAVTGTRRASIGATSVRSGRRSSIRAGGAP